MKHIVRTLIILAAAILISAITYVIVNNSAAQSTLAGSPREGEGMHRGRGNLEGAALDGFPEGRMEHFGQEGAGLAGLAKNLSIIAGIVAVYWLLSKASDFIRKFAARKPLKTTQV
jgi:hypothetical protein